MTIRQPFTLSIALRYLRARSRGGFISFISLVSMLGIALAIAVLITVMSVVNGFESELERRILGVVADGSITGYEAPLEDWRADSELALERPDVLAVAPFVEGQGMIAAEDDILGVSVRGIDPELERGVSTIADLVTAGSIDALVPGEWRIVLGRALAEDLGVGLGDEVVLVLPEARVTLAGLMPRDKAFTVGGLFDVGMAEYDRGLVLIQMDEAAKLFRTNGRASGLSFKFDDLYSAPRIVVDVARALGGGFYYSDWTRQYANVFRSIQLTKPILFISLSLVIAVAAFNIVSTLVMVVREKRGDIAILRSFGATPRNILSVFAAQGTAIGIIGTLAGLALGLTLVAYLDSIVAVIESSFGIDLLSADVYLIGDLPTEARLGETVRICVLAFSLAVAATLYPAITASRQPPAEALRYE